MAGRLNYSGGRLRVGGGDEYYILIPLRAYRAIIDAMTSLVGEAAAGPLYFLGKKIGKGLVEEMERLLAGSNDIRSIIEAYAGYLSELGFGKVEVLGVEGDTATIRMVNPPSLEGAKEEGVRVVGKGGQRGVCHLERGMVAAVFDAITGKRYRAVEVGHSLEPEPYCVLKIMPALLLGKKTETVTPVRVN